MISVEKCSDNKFNCDRIQTATVLHLIFHQLRELNHAGIHSFFLFILFFFFFLRLYAFSITIFSCVFCFCLLTLWSYYLLRDGLLSSSVHNEMICNFVRASADVPFIVRIGLARLRNVRHRPTVTMLSHPNSAEKPAKSHLSRLKTRLNRHSHLIKFHLYHFVCCCSCFLLFVQFAAISLSYLQFMFCQSSLFATSTI